MEKEWKHYLEGLFGGGDDGSSDEVEPERLERDDEESTLDDATAKSKPPVRPLEFCVPSCFRLAPVSLPLDNLSSFAWSSATVR